VLGASIQNPASGFLSYRGADNLHLVDLDSGLASSLFDESVELIPDLFHLGMVFRNAVWRVPVLPRQDLDEDEFGPFLLAGEDDVRFREDESELSADRVVLLENGEKVSELAFPYVIGDVNSLRRSGS